MSALQRDCASYLAIPDCITEGSRTYSSFFAVYHRTKQIYWLYYTLPRCSTSVNSWSVFCWHNLAAMQTRATPCQWLKLYSLEKECSLSYRTIWCLRLSLLACDSYVSVPVYQTKPLKNVILIYTTLRTSNLLLPCHMSHMLDALIHMKIDKKVVKL
jgi:hypothetical protein